MRKLIHKILCHFGHHDYCMTGWNTLFGKTKFFKYCIWCDKIQDDSINPYEVSFPDLSSISVSFMKEYSNDEKPKYLN